MRTLWWLTWSIGLLFVDGIRLIRDVIEVVLINLLWAGVDDNDLNPPRMDE